MVFYIKSNCWEKNSKNYYKLDWTSQQTFCLCVCGYVYFCLYECVCVDKEGYILFRFLMYYKTIKIILKSKVKPLKSINASQGIIDNDKLNKE